jgi:acyl carrier protein
MDRKELESKILEYAAITYRKEPGSLSLDARFKEDLGGASILMVGLVSLIENELDVLVSLPEASQAKTVGDLVNIVESLMGN